MAPPSAWETGIAVDLLLEIVARTDVKTVVRTAATCRLFRRAILEPASRSRLALQLAADDGTGFDPALLLGVSYQEHDGKITTYRIVHTPAPDQLRARLDAGSLRESFRPVASRDRLLLLRRHSERRQLDLRVSDVLTGHVTDLPPVSLPDAYQYVFLCVGDGDAAGASFDLLVMDHISRRYQILSAEEGRWGPVRQASLPSHHPNPVNRLCTSRPAVIGRTVYWTCCTNAYWDRILALDVDAAKTTLMKLPGGFICGVIPRESDKCLLLASVRGRLSLLFSDLHGITMWTLTPATAATATATWSRRVVIGLLEIKWQVEDFVCTRLLNLEEFGERSGTVILHLGGCGKLFRLDLGIKEETPVAIRRIKGPGSARVTSLFLHETDLISLLKAMKSV
ncbi:hypothetical protein QYE76_061538 [Lolium multiflorum]|uniref:DUF7595 domain-containing protein n=1 Tax=Lolium multiflorum TaxID=4521 RepID=A0AAD8S2D8_LOLMU|nr:hypothetical protein QYE76_061538 [Lolium multiflorum]